MEAVKNAHHQTAEQFSDAQPGMQIPIKMPNTIRYTIIMHCATQKPTIENGRRLGTIFDALIGNDTTDTWDWDDITTPRKGPDHTPDNPQWQVGLREGQSKGEYTALFDQQTAQHLWDELGRKFAKQSEKPEPIKGPPCQHCGRADPPDERWNLTQMRQATKIYDRLGRMLGQEDGTK